MSAEQQTAVLPAPARGRAAAATEGWFRTSEVLEILGISRRQLQYWAKTDLVMPSAHTPGGHHRYTFEDLVALKATKRLIDAGISVQRIRTSIQSLRKLLPTIERPLSELVLVATGDVVLVFAGGTVFEAVTGQEWVFEVAQFQRELEDWDRAQGGSGRRRAAPLAPSQRSQTG